MLDMNKTTRFAAIIAFLPTAIGLAQPVTSLVQGTQFIGVAATTEKVLFTRPFCQTGVTTAISPPGSSINPRQIFQLHGDGSVTVFGSLPDIPHQPEDGSTCYENYLTISPGGGAWTSLYGHVFVLTANPTDSTASDVYHFGPTGTNYGVFTTIHGLQPMEHAGIAFDSVGTWGFNLLVGGANGVYVIGPTGAILQQFPNPTTSASAVFESLRVAPMTYPDHQGWIFAVGDDVNNASTPGVWAFGPPGCSGLSCQAVNVLAGSNEPYAETLNFVPPVMCSFTVKGVPYPYFLVRFDATTVFTDMDTNHLAIIGGVPLSQFTPAANSLLIQSEDAGTVNVYTASNTPPASTFIQFPNPPGVNQEDSTMVLCGAFNGCPATKGFWHTISRWPNVTATVDGVTYNGGTDHSMVIGGITYTQSQLELFLPTGGSSGGGNGYLIGGSELIAAVLNIAADGQHSASVDSTIAAMNNALMGHNMICSGSICGAPANPLNNNLKNWGAALDSYNNAVGLGCAEGSGLELGGN